MKNAFWNLRTFFSVILRNENWSNFVLQKVNSWTERTWKKYTGVTTGDLNLAAPRHFFFQTFFPPTFSPTGHSKGSSFKKVAEEKETNRLREGTNPMAFLRRNSTATKCLLVRMTERQEAFVLGWSNEKVKKKNRSMRRQSTKGRGERGPVKGQRVETERSGASNSTEAC